MLWDRLLGTGVPTKYDDKVCECTLYSVHAWEMNRLKSFGSFNPTKPNKTDFPYSTTACFFVYFYFNSAGFGPQGGSQKL